MKITYDNVSSGYLYPLDSKTDLDVFRERVEDKILSKILKIRFGCNWKTTQEARLIQRGKNFDIRINFCLKDDKSKILSDKKDWLRIIEKFGGVLDQSRNEVSWSMENAKRYSLFLLFHEVGHIEYCIKHLDGRISDNKGSSAEERWCEKYALDIMNKI
jgi:hypothetical protein